MVALEYRSAKDSNMKLLAALLALFCASAALAVPASKAKPTRQLFAEENDPLSKRYMYVETNGKLELVDLLADAPPSPRAVTATDVSFHLYTQTTNDAPFSIRNGDVSQLRGTPFDPSKISLFVAHGWRNNRNSSVNQHVRTATLANFDYNVFVIDWEGPANAIYLSAKDAVVPVGQIVGNFINSIQAAYQLTGESFILVGHSLGAHVVGNAGAVVNDRVARIIGLDPASPLFTVNNKDNRLDETDGDFVQIIHTNGGTLGFASSLGHADYYPNGGKSQPGCGIDLGGSCAHSRSYEYFGESILRGAVFLGLQCTSWSDFQKGRCSDNYVSPMGQLDLDTSAAGDFFLTTSSVNPFGTSSVN